MMNQMDFTQFNQPPFLPQFMCEGEPKKFATIGDTGWTSADDAAISVVDSLDLASATGVSLDRAGKILAIPRDGKADDTYQVALQLKAILNKSRGTIEDVITLIRLLYEATSVVITPTYPAGISIVHNGKVSLDGRLLAYFSDGWQIGYISNDTMVFSTPDYSLDSLIISAIPAGISYTITKV